MNTYLATLYCPDNDQLKDVHVIYSNNDNEIEIEEQITNLPEYYGIKQNCIDTWKTEVSLNISKPTDDLLEWIKTLPIIIDER